jgi:hypothetical protein
MNFLERSALRRIQRYIGPAMESGEQTLEFDIGRNAGPTATGVTVDCIATNRAVYMLSRTTGGFLRLPYSEIARVQATSSRMAIETKSDEMFLIDFGRGPRGFGEVVMKQHQLVRKAG